MKNKEYATILAIASKMKTVERTLTASVLILLITPTVPMVTGNNEMLKLTTIAIMRMA